MIKYPYDEFGRMKIIQKADVIEERYGARIIDCENGKPIEKSFGLFK